MYVCMYVYARMYVCMYHPMICMYEIFVYDVCNDYDICEEEEEEEGRRMIDLLINIYNLSAIYLLVLFLESTNYYTNIIHKLIIHTTHTVIRYAKYESTFPQSCLHFEQHPPSIQSPHLSTQFQPNELHQHETHEDISQT